MYNLRFRCAVLSPPRCQHEACRVVGLPRSNPTQVLHIAHDQGALVENQQQRETRQRRAFLRELEAMIRLRSPNTVIVFGAVTSLPDRMVLVMELLPNGDLLTLLKRST